MAAVRAASSAAASEGERTSSHTRSPARVSSATHCRCRPTSTHRSADHSPRQANYRRRIVDAYTKLSSHLQTIACQDEAVMRTDDDVRSELVGGTTGQRHVASHDAFGGVVLPQHLTGDCAARECACARARCVHALASSSDASSGTCDTTLIVCTHVNVRQSGELVDGPCHCATRARSPSTGATRRRCCY